LIATAAQWRRPDGAQRRKISGNFGYGTRLDISEARRIGPMRVAITLLVALAAAVSGPMPAFASCSSGSGGGSSSTIAKVPKIVLNPILKTMGLKPIGGGTTTNTTNITNNTTNNTTNITNVTAAEPQTGQPTQAALALGPGGGSGAGGGGGFGGMGGGFSGNSGSGGTPINPSDTPSTQMAGSGSSSNGGGGGGATFSSPITMASLGSTTTDGPGNVVMMATADQSSDQPLTPGVSLATGPAPVSGADDAMTVAMASPKTERPATSDGFTFEGQATPASSRAPGTVSTTMLAALIGVGMLGAGWAWRSFGV
jgi:hypothetical protein